MHPLDKPSNTTSRQQNCWIWMCYWRNYLLFILFCTAATSHFYIGISSSLEYSRTEIKRPTYISRDHGFCGPCPKGKRLFNAWQLTDLVTLISPNIPFLVNIGAASPGGDQYDSTYPLLSAINSSFGALLIDPNTNPSLFNAYPNLDIDSYEYSLLENILHTNYRPQIIRTKFNPIFRPPVIFMPIYNSTTKNDWKPSLWADSGSFYGCSLSALSKLLKSFDYILVEVDFWDVIYIQRELAQSTHIQVPANDDVAYQYGFLNHSCFPYCRENVKLHNNGTESAIKFALNQSNLTAYMTNVMDSYAPISLKNNLKKPYIISV